MLAEKYTTSYTDVENCYHLFLGNDYFEFVGKEPGTYFLTNYLADFFDELVVRPLKLDIHPQLKDLMFRHYKRIIFIDTDGTGITPAARNVSAYLDLTLIHMKADLEFFETVMLAGWR